MRATFLLRIRKEFAVLMNYFDEKKIESGKVFFLSTFQVSFGFGLNEILAPRQAAPYIHPFINLLNTFIHLPH